MNKILELIITGIGLTFTFLVWSSVCIGVWLEERGIILKKNK